MKNTIIIVSFLFIITVCASGENLPAFFENLYGYFSADYQRLKAEKYAEFCRNFGVRKETENNIRAFHLVNFQHDCFTGTSAIDFTSRGYFNIPYVWHWCEPNRRLEIVHLSDSTRLGNMNPPAEYNKFKTFGHIDRSPFIYLGDLVRDEPRYYHPNFGNFRTFGWCSEREMSFCLLMELLGTRGKIKQEGIHVWTELWLEFEGIDGNRKIICASVDNTFDILDWFRAKADLNFANWAKDIGQGTDIKFYNDKAHSRDEMNKIKTINVSQKAAGSLKEMIQTVLRAETR